MTTVDMTNKHQAEFTQVVFLKAHIKMAKTGMKPRPPMTKAKLMEKAKTLTGVSFGIRDYDAAIDALEKRRDILLKAIANDG